MKVLITLFLIFLSASALGVSKRSGKQISIHSLHLEKISSLGSALKGLIQLADAHELDPVIQIITEIMEELSGLQGSNQQDLAVLTQQHEIDQATAQESLNNIRDSLASANQDLENNQNAAANLQAAIDANVNAINDATAAIDAENQRRAAAHAAYQQHISNVNQAVGAIQDAQSVLQEIRDADLTVGGSFLQMQKKKFTKSLSLVQKKLSKVMLRTSPTEVYIKELVQIAQDVEAQATVNADLIDQISVLLETFKQSLLQEAADAQAADDEDESQSQNALGLLDDTVATQRASLSDNQGQLANVEGAIDALEGQIANLEQNEQDAEDNLANIEANFAQQSEILGGYIRRLSIDIDVLERALVFVQTEAAQISDGPSDESESSDVEVVVVDGGNGVAVGDSDAPVEPPALVWVTGDEDYPPISGPEVNEPEPAPWQTGPGVDAQEDADVQAESDESEASEESESSDGEEVDEVVAVAVEESSDGEEVDEVVVAAVEESEESEESEEASDEEGSEY